VGLGENPLIPLLFIMDNEIIINLLYVFVLAAFLGYLVISKVPPLLHTP